MTTASIGDLVGWRVKAIQEGKRFERTPRKHSYDEHDPRAQIFRPVCGGRTAEALRWRDKLVQVAREYNTLHKKKGEREGPLGSNGLWVLEVLLGFVDFATGRCDPAIDTICAKARLARATVVRAIEALKAHGFIDKVRRTRRTGRSACEGPQREQITNAYAFATKLAATVQQRFAQLVGGRKRAEAIQARKKAEAAERQALLAQPLSGLGSALHPGDRQMARVLDALGTHFDGQPSCAPSASSVAGEYPASGI